MHGSTYAANILKYFVCMYVKTGATKETNSSFVKCRKTICIKKTHNLEITANNSYKKSSFVSLTEIFRNQLPELYLIVGCINYTDINIIIKITHTSDKGITS